MTSKYYVKVAYCDLARFELHLIRNSISSEQMVSCFGGAESHVMYALNMDTQQELNLKLSFPLIGCMNFQKTIGRQIKAIRV